ncbi:MAG: FAD-dependent oxidoreductase [Pseudomonadota bacterium]
MIVVIGRGLIGSAAAKYLAAAGNPVTLIGPPEGHTPGSHWDEGRITRRNATDPFWSDVSSASIARYAEIEAASGITFFSETGAMMAGPKDSTFFHNTLATRDRIADAGDHLTRADLATRFPFFAFGDTIEAVYEPQGAGHISPRKLVEAQTKLAAAAGARLVPEPALSLSAGKGEVTITTPSGNVTADQVLVAVGGLTGHLLPETPPLSVYARTVAFFEVSSGEVERLTTMPSLVYRDEAGADPYILPPIRYPDGKIYLKIGGDPVDKPLSTAEEIHAWYRTQGSAEIRDHLEASIRRLMPTLAIRSTHSAACMTTFSQTGYPIITRLTDRITVATAGNGAGAKCSDELGRLGAAALLNAQEPQLAKTG